jgi:hypothetical protein
MSDDVEVAEEDIRFNAHAFLRSLLRRTLNITEHEKWSDLENDDIGMEVSAMSMDIEDYLASMGIKL